MDRSILAHGNGLDELVVRRRTPLTQRSRPVSEQQPDPATDDGDLADPATSHGSDLDARIGRGGDQPEQTLSPDEAGP